MPATVVTDAKCIWDATRSESSDLGMSERRTGIELMAAKEEMAATGLELRWGHSESQLGDGLTKPSASARTLEFFRSGQVWRLVYDELMQSSRNRKKVGKGTLD